MALAVCVQAISSKERRGDIIDERKREETSLMCTNIQHMFIIGLTLAKSGRELLRKGEYYNEEL